jgi:PAS domain S-box-containing protein
MVRKSEAQKSAEAEVGVFQRGLGPFVVAGELTRMPIVFTNARDPACPIIFANDSLLSLTGHHRAELLGESLYSLFAEDADSSAVSAVRRGVQRGSGVDCEIKCRRKDGSSFWAALFVNPVSDGQGKIIQHFVSFIDLTKHKQAQAQAKMLIDELSHRVKNTLATVQAIVRQALRSDVDRPTLRQMIKSRLSALSRSHDLLTRGKWKGAGLHEIISETLAPFQPNEAEEQRFIVTGEPMRFPPKAALDLCIVFNELATNAVKYGALSRLGGKVHIDWKLEPSAQGQRLALTWRELGGPAVRAPAHRGFGTRVIERGLAHELGGAGGLDYRPEGLVCTMIIPAVDDQNG